MTTEYSNEEAADLRILLRAFGAYLQARWALFSTIGVLLLFGIAPRIVPGQFFWVFLFEQLGLYRYWPLVILMVGIYFVVTGFWRYRALGMPQYFPLLAGLAVFLLPILVAVLLTDTAADWSIVWSGIALFILALAVLAGTIGLIAYTELWRTLVNPWIVRQVSSTLGHRRFREIVQKQLRHPDTERKAVVSVRDVLLLSLSLVAVLFCLIAILLTAKVTDWLVARIIIAPIALVMLALATLVAVICLTRIAYLDKWGSPHCLCIVQGYYDETKQKALDDLDSTISWEKLEACLDAGENLLLYLSLHWPEQLMKPRTLAWRRTELLRELITLGLKVEQWYQQQLAPRIDGWIDQLRGGSDWISEPRTDGNSYGRYLQLLVLVFDLGKGTGEMQTPVSTGGVIGQATELFNQLPSTGPAAIDHMINLREVCANSWLALAHRSLPKQACFDVWMAMRTAQNKDLFVSPERSPKHDPAAIAARRCLAEWYGEWRDTTHRDWHQGLAGRARYAQELAEQ